MGCHFQVNVVFSGFGIGMLYFVWDVITGFSVALCLNENGM